MKIVVCVKQVSAFPGPAVLLGDGSEADPLFTVRRLNEADENAVEEALRICEVRGGGEVVVVSVGPEAVIESLRKCLAMGAHRAIRSWGEAVQLYDPLSVARALAHAVRSEAADLVLCGVISTDISQQATGPALASALQLPCITIATKLEIDQHAANVIIHRETTGGVTEVIAAALPAVVSIQTGCNTPRFPSFKGVMLAKKTPIPCIDPGSVAQSRMQVLGMTVNTRNRSRLQVMEGGAAEIAASISRLVREARQ